MLMLLLLLPIYALAARQRASAVPRYVARCVDDGDDAGYASG